MPGIGEILAALLAIPKLIDRLDFLVKRIELIDLQKWNKDSIEIERRIEAAETKEELRELAKDLQSLIRRS